MNSTKGQINDVSMTKFDRRRTISLERIMSLDEWSLERILLKILDNISTPRTLFYFKKFGLSFFSIS